MKSLIIGSGGREHAIAVKIAQSDSVDSVLVIPGNPGMCLNDKTGKISIESPIGQALVGKAVGDVVTVTVPAGELELEIKKIEL